MSDTPIYDRLVLEYEWWGMPSRTLLGLDQSSPEAWRNANQCLWAVPEESTVSVEILPDTTNFLTGMRVGGRRAGRSAERADALRNLRVIQWQAERNAEDLRMMTLYSGKSIRECLSMWPTPEWKKPRPTYSAEAHELSRNTGWSLEESEDMIHRVAKWAEGAIAEENIKAIGRTRMSKQNHYPTSTPSWARRSRR